MADTQQPRHSVPGGVALGTIISLVFLAIAAVPAALLLQLLVRSYELQQTIEINDDHIVTWDNEIKARELDIQDLTHFLPSHGRPAANPPSTNPTVTPPPHD
jgi:hypothetical protein